MKRMSAVNETKEYNYERPLQIKINEAGLILIQVNSLKYFTDERSECVK